ANAVSPNAQTRMIASIPDEKRAELTAGIPLGRFADPAEMAAAVSLLASEEAGYITGVVLPVDGGLSRSPTHSDTNPGAHCADFPLHRRAVRGGRYPPRPLVLARDNPRAGGRLRHRDRGPSVDPHRPAAGCPRSLRRPDRPR